jgi:Flp pilus assembly protein CpaB
MNWATIVIVIFIIIIIVAAIIVGIVLWRRSQTNNKDQRTNPKEETIRIYGITQEKHTLPSSLSYNRLASSEWIHDTQTGEIYRSQLQTVGNEQHRVCLHATNTEVMATVCSNSPHQRWTVMSNGLIRSDSNNRCLTSSRCGDKPCLVLGECKEANIKVNN